MAFKPVNFARLARFNSATSSSFLQMYEDHVDRKIKEAAARPSSKNIAPSSFRCARIQWFRLRGVAPDVPRTSDRTLQFTADVGTACHRVIQSNLKEALQDNWISVSDYLAKFPIPYEYELTEDEDSLETKVAITDPPIHFACDGIVFWEGRYWLLEIKTSEYSSFEDLTDIKPQHREQIRIYATLLRLAGVLVVYQDRLYGGLKCYEVKVSDSDKEAVLTKIRFIQECVSSCIAPDKLPPGDPWCSSSRCPYYLKCKQW